MFSTCFLHFSRALHFAFFGYVGNHSLKVCSLDSDLYLYFCRADYLLVRQVCCLSLRSLTDEFVCLTRSLCYLLSCSLVTFDWLHFVFFCILLILLFLSNFSLFLSLTLSNSLSLWRFPHFHPALPVYHDVTDKEKEKNTQSIFDRERLPKV